LNQASPELKAELNNWLSRNLFDPQEKVGAVIKIYDKLNIREKATEIMQMYFSKANKDIESVSALDYNKRPLLELSERLMVREK
jgi:geranylgeranyl diphosphate synthase type II